MDGSPYQCGNIFVGLRWAGYRCRELVVDCPNGGIPDVLGHQYVSFRQGDIVPRAKEHQLVEVLMRGGLVLAGISLFHRSEVDSIFEVLIGSDTEIVWLFLQAVGVLTIVLIPTSLSRNRSKNEQHPVSK